MLKNLETTNPESTDENKRTQQANPLKPFNFCCSIENDDPLAKYDKLTAQYNALRKPVHRIHESPTLKFKTQTTGLEDDDTRRMRLRHKNLNIGDHRRKNYMRNYHNVKNTRFKGTDKDGFEHVYVPEDLHDEALKQLLEKPIKWYVEDELEKGKDTFWEKKQRMSYEEMEANTALGKKKARLTISRETNIYPQWYQDFSIEQMKNLGMLQCVMHKDCKAMVVGRTQRTLASIGIISTFFPLAPDVIRKLQESSNCNVIQFLREVYKMLTGNYFEEEGYKKFYDTNERIILSSIAFLTLPETVMELHKRLPSIKMPKLQPKPMPQALTRMKMSSPYEEAQFIPPDWAFYLNQLESWKEERQLTPMPKLILPPKHCIISSFESIETNTYKRESRGSKLSNFQQNNQLVKSNSPLKTRPNRTVSIDRKQKQSILAKTEEKDKNNTIKNTATEARNSERKQSKDNSTAKKMDSKNNDSEAFEEEEEEEEDDVDSGTNTNQQMQKYDTQKFEKLDIPPLYGENTLFDFTINGICEKPGPVEYKICGVLQPPQPNKKSWLDEKHAHYIIAGASEEPPTCPVTYEMTGIANVTPTNSDERFFAVLKLGDGPNKIYPSGRKNLSRHWQEWLQNVDEEFRKVEREANKMIKNIEAVTKLVFPGPTCDSCCSCRQTRKSYLKAKETKAPYFVIDTITEDDHKNKYIVGSMAMHSPAPTPPESTVNLLEVIASEDVLTTNLVINGVTNEKGEMQYFITGSKKEVIRVPGRVVEPPPPLPPRNVPPCMCAIQQVLNKGLSPTVSHDNIPWTKQDGLCFGKKFRPQEAPAYSCKMYPGDKSCRRSPFMHEIMKLKRKAEKAKAEEKKNDGTAKEKKMYSIADFQPCGDEHGMNVCGAPWGTLHTLTPEELAEQDRIRKEILRAPPCGMKPGQAVCEGPFGERVPLKKSPTFTEEAALDEEEELEEEEEEEGEEKVQEQKPVVKTVEKKRARTCYMSPEAIAERKKKVAEKKVKPFIPDPNYPGYDDPWNIFRTAPTMKESETDFKALLKLSSPKRPSTPVQSKLLIADSGQPAGGDAPESNRKKVDSKSSGGTPKKGPVSSSKLSTKTILSSKVENEEKVSKGKEKSTQQKDTLNTESKKISDKLSKNDVVVDKMENTSITKPTKGKSNQTIEKSRTPTTSTKNQYKSLKTSESVASKKTSTRRIRRSNKSGEAIRSIRNIEINKSEKDGKTTVKPERQASVLTNMKKKKVTKQKSTSLTRKKSIKRDKKRDINFDQIDNIETSATSKIQELKSIMKSSKLYPYDVKPVDIPKDPPGKCKTACEDSEEETDSMQVEDDGVPLSNKGPCGWKTKSEQELPTKKTLVYLTDPDYPPETVPVKPGGKPCLCRENRAKKKILLYNIGGLIGGKKDDEESKMLKKKKGEDKKMQVIDGVIYYTPPPSPRRSDEYVPEYDLYDSPYDMCHTQRKDMNLKYLDRYSRPKTLESSTARDPCGCNQYIDTYGIKETTETEENELLMKALEKKREQLVNEKAPKERWKLALQDVGLNDYFTRCRDSMPCWLKCVKFNKVGCIVPRKKLKTKRPVCECKYERKVLEHREEKLKYKEREKRLKSLKKQPYVNVADISKPLIQNTKLMISEVKRIPQDDEYIDDIKYCISGVAENYSHLPPKQIVGGIQMATPIQTPEPSEQEIPCVCLHRHWSPMNIPPGALPKPGEIMLAEKKRRQEAVKEAFKEIYAPQPVYHTHDDHSCKEKCNLGSGTESDEDLTKLEQVENNTASRLKIPVKTNLGNFPLQKSNADNSPNEGKRKQIAPKRTFEAKGKTIKQEQKEYAGGNPVSNDSARLNVENIDSSNKENKESHSDDKEYSLIAIVKAELKKMAIEGFIFAKLPKCFLMPQLQYWLIYRKGIALTSADKHNSVRKSIMMWNMLDIATAGSRVEPPSLEITPIERDKLTFDDAVQMKEKIEMKKAIFFSEIRKKRVLYGRSMWNTMEYGKYPSISFKQAYFTYMAGKEADGHVFKPWLLSDVREKS